MAYRYSYATKQIRSLNSGEGNIAGFTLVEVLVAGVLITLSTIAAVSVVNTGTMLERSDSNRRQARAVIRSLFEQSYDFRDYNKVPADSTRIDSIVVDERQGNPLNGVAIVKIVTDTITTNNDSKMPVKKISITCKWVEENGVGDSITLDKILANAQ